MLIILFTCRNINVEATKIVHIMQSRVNNYNRKLLRPAASAACIIPNNALGFSNYVFLSHGQRLQCKVHSYRHLIVKDLDKAYFLPYLRSSYCKRSRLYNDNKYMYFDYALRDTKESDLMRPVRHLATIGDAIPSLSDIKPDALQSNHWKKWLPVFPAAKVKSVEDGFADDIPVVTTGPLQSLPAMKHVIDPDLHNELLRKSTIPRIGVPNPRLTKEENVTFPCMLKVDQSRGGCGNWMIRNSHQLKEVVAEIRNKCNGKGKYILQEYIPDAVTMEYYFYLLKSGDIHWLGNLTGLIQTISIGLLEWVTGPGKRS